MLADAFPFKLRIESEARRRAKRRMKRPILREHDGRGMSSSRVWECYSCNRLRASLNGRPEFENRGSTCTYQQFHMTGDKFGTINGAISLVAIWYVDIMTSGPVLAAWAIAPCRFFFSKNDLIKILIYIYFVGENKIYKN